MPVGAAMTFLIGLLTCVSLLASVSMLAYDSVLLCVGALADVSS